MRLNPKGFWTVNLTREMWPRMNLRSVSRYRDYALRERAGKLRPDALLQLQMKLPLRGNVYLREVGSDILTFEEVLLEQVYRTVLDHVKECETLIDLGANIGLASIYLGAHYPSCRIFAVEPNPSTYKILSLNLMNLINEGRCETLEAAVWGSEKNLALDPTHAPDHYSVATVTELADPDSAQDSILGLPIDKIIERAGFEQVGLLKVDIEGGEVELFKGDLNWLTRVHCIAIEFHERSRETTNFDQIMRDYGFEVFDQNTHTILAVKK